MQCFKNKQKIKTENKKSEKTLKKSQLQKSQSMKKCFEKSEKNKKISCAKASGVLNFSHFLTFSLLAVFSAKIAGATPVNAGDFASFESLLNNSTNEINLTNHIFLENVFLGDAIASGVTINGNGFNLDGVQAHQFFNLSSVLNRTKTINFNNINIVNGDYTRSNVGIFSYGQHIFNGSSIFSNNNAKYSSLSLYSE